MCCHEKREGCRKPENLTAKAEDCTPDRIRRCHGEAKDHPCAATAVCEQPERLQGAPAACSPEQVRRCHGDAENHPCESRE